MNLKFGRDFNKLEVKEGILENTSDYVIVELCIVNQREQPQVNKLGNINLYPRDKHIINLVEQDIWARAVNDVVGELNYLEADVNGSDISLTDYYNKQSIDEKLEQKSDKSDTYTKSEVDGKLDLKVNIDGLKQLSEEDFTSQLKNKLDSLPENAYNKSEVDEKLGLKVDKSGSKQLSDENFTTDLKTKLENLDVSTLQPKNESSLNTSAKTIVGAINELLEKINSLSSQP